MQHHLAEMPIAYFRVLIFSWTALVAFSLIC